METLFVPRYRPIQKRVLHCRLPSRHHLPDCYVTYEVMERINTGLGFYYCVEPDGQGSYALMHLASGAAITNLRMYTSVQAARWLRLIAPLCDWTQVVERLQTRKDVEQAVRAAHWLALLQDGMCKTV